MTLELRLAEVLRGQMRKQGMSCRKLSEKIDEANRKREAYQCPSQIDHRRLRAIVEGKSYTLNEEILRALDNYLISIGEPGLAEQPLLRRVGILDAIAQTDHISVFIGARPRNKHLGRESPNSQRRHDVSVWDIRALNVLLVGIIKRNPHVAYELREIISHYPPRIDQLRQHLAVEHSIVCIGSSRACQFTELVACEMLGIGEQAFLKPTAAIKKLPFHFVWPPRDPDIGIAADSTDSQWFQSRFALNAEDIPDKNLARDIAGGRCLAFQIGEQIRRVAWDSSAPRDERRDYGVLIAQRRTSRSIDQPGPVWMALCGLSGIGSYGAAIAVNSLVKEALPDDGTPLIKLVAVPVTNNAEPDGDNREAGNVELLSIDL